MVKNKTLPAGHPLLDFRIMLKEVWEHLGLPAPTAVQNNIAYCMQHGSDRDIIEAFRGVGKSWIVCVYVCWCLLLDPNYKIEIISAGEDLAIANATFIKRLISEITFLQHLQPRDNQRSSNTGFDVGPAAAAPAPAVKAVGILGQITGTRADLIIADDIEIPKNSDSQGQRDKIRQLVTEFEAILKPEGGDIKYLGTPQLTDSLYNNLPENYRVQVWPAEVPSVLRLDRDSTKLAQYIKDLLLIDGLAPGAPVEPTRFSTAVLEQKKLGMGVSNYNLQFQLDTDSSDATRYPLKCRDLIVMDLDKSDGHDKVYYASSSEQELKGLHNVGLRGDRFYKPLKLSVGMSKYERILMAIDPAGTGKDETTYVILGQLNSQLFVLEWMGMQGGYGEEVLEHLAGRAEFFKITDCIIEDNFGDGMFRTLFQPYLNKNQHGKARAEGIKVFTQKEIRIIDTLEPIMNQHRLIVDRKVIEDDFNSVARYNHDIAYRYRGFFQLTHITKEKHSLGKDDRVDVLALGCRHLIDGMELNQEQHVESLQLERDMKQMKFWVDAMGNTERTARKQVAPNWMTY